MYVEALYTDDVGREVFRELLLDPGCGLPTAVRHRDGFGYVLVVESTRRAVYRRTSHPHLPLPRHVLPADVYGHIAN